MSLKDSANRSIPWNVVFAALGIMVLFTGQSVARADDYAYETTSSAQFGIIDLTTGVFTQLGNSSIPLIGLGAYGGNLYGPGLHSGTLYQVNTANGALITIGKAAFAYRGFGSTTSGLYGFDQNMNLYSINPVTGAAALIGPTGLANPGGFGVSTGSATLYITPTPEGSTRTPLYSVNTSTGSAILIGYPGFYGSGASVYVNGTLYAGAFSPLAVYTLNTQAGVGKLVAHVSGTGSYFYGLAPASQADMKGSHMSPPPNDSVVGQVLLGCHGRQASAHLSLSITSLNSSTGLVNVNGVDDRRPNKIPFTWIWGDGSVTQGWFPQSHVYGNAKQNYLLQVTSHEDDGSTDCAQIVIPGPTSSLLSAQENPSLLNPARAIIVRADQPWTPTGIQLQVGDDVTVTARGVIRTNLNGARATPAGTVPDCIDVGTVRVPFVAPELPCWSLLGRIGRSGNVFEVGTSRRFKANANGELYLGVNDNFFADNSGHWTAGVAVSTSPLGVHSTKGGWFGFANDTSPQDREVELRQNCGDFKRVDVPDEVGNKYTDLCRSVGGTCERVCDWQGTSFPCDAVSLGGARDGTRVALCR
jgi:hypothetical protein